MPKLPLGRLSVSALHFLVVFFVHLCACEEFCISAGRSALPLPLGGGRVRGKQGHSRGRDETFGTACTRGAPPHPTLLPKGEGATAASGNTERFHRRSVSGHGQGDRRPRTEMSVPS